MLTTHPGVRGDILKEQRIVLSLGTTQYAQQGTFLRVK